MQSAAIEKQDGLARPTTRTQGQEPPGISDLTPEILSQIFSDLSLVGDGFNLVCTSRWFYATFIEELYKQSGRQCDWVPLFVGAIDGNLNTLKRCLEFGAPIDHQWHGESTGWWVLNIPRGARPLHVAMQHYRVKAVGWMLAKKANPGRINEDDSMPPIDLASALLDGQYPRSQQVAARWRRWVRIPGRAALAQRGRCIIDALERADASDGASLVGRLGQEGKELASEGHVHQDRLSRLPYPVLALLLSHLPPTEGAQLVATSRFFYQNLYWEWCRQLDWLPLFIGAMDGNLHAVKRCLAVGATVDQPWAGSCRTARPLLLNGTRPLQVAIQYARVECVRWLLCHGANPSRTREGEQQPSPLKAAARYYVRPPKEKSKQAERWKREGSRMPDSLQLELRYSKIFELLVQAGADDAIGFYDSGTRGWVHDDHPIQVSVSLQPNGPGAPRGERLS